MIKRTNPTAYRKHGQGLTKQNFQLSRRDLSHLEETRTAFENQHGVSASMSIILSLALASIVDEVRAGKVRWSEDLRSTVVDR